MGGWLAAFDQVSTTVHLPDGYRLLAAPGADLAQGSWIAAWDLYDVFLGALLVLFAARLLGIKTSALYYKLEKYGLTGGQAS